MIVPGAVRFVTDAVAAIAITLRIGDCNAAMFVEVEENEPVASVDAKLSDAIQKATAELIRMKHDILREYRPAEST